MTASTAVSNDPPISCGVRVRTLELAIWKRSSPTYAAVMIGMVTAPSPTPRISSHSASSQSSLVAPTQQNGTVAAATTTNPTAAIERVPVLSVSGQAIWRIGCAHSRARRSHCGQQAGYILDADEQDVVADDLGGTVGDLLDVEA